MLIANWLQEAKEKLESAEITSHDAELIAAHVRDSTLAQLRLDTVLEKTLSAEEVRRAETLLEERLLRVPLQHLTGRAPFRHIELEVGPGVFIPRPETEIVAQFAIDELLNQVAPEVFAADLCTGSGAIALSIISEVQNARVFAIELDENAHAWAKRNVAKLGDSRVTLLHADALAPNETLLGQAGKFTVVISNPPYVPSAAIPKDPEVRDHDPELALYSGQDGLDAIRQISQVAMPLLGEGGLIVLEHAERQGAAVREILKKAGYKAPATHRDLTMRDRVTTARR